MHSSFALSVVKYFLFRLNAWSLKLALRHNILIWSLKVSQMSHLRPSKTTLEDFLIFILLISSMIDYPVLSTKIINWNFFGLGFIEVTLNHFNIFCITFLFFCKIVCRLILQLYIVLSSAKLHIFVLSTKKKRLEFRNFWLVSFFWRRRDIKIPLCLSPPVRKV